MINDVDDALRDLLLREMPVRKGDVDVAFNQPRREWSARLSRPTLNLYLYDIRENLDLRSSEQVLRQELDEGKVALYHSVTRIDLCYLLTAWTKEVQDEHRLLSTALLAMLRSPIIPPEVLPEALRNLPMPLRMEIAQSETIKDIVDLWSSLDNEMHPAVRIKVTIAIEPFAPDIAATVAGAEFRFNQAKSEAGASQDRENGDMAPSKGYQMVRGKISSEKYSLPVLKMILKETGKEIQIREDGQFMISRLQAGEYHLEVRANDRVLKLQAIKVPSPRYDFQV